MSLDINWNHSVAHLYLHRRLLFGEIEFHGGENESKKETVEKNFVKI